MIAGAGAAGLAGSLRCRARHLVIDAVKAANRTAAKWFPL